MATFSCLDSVNPSKFRAENLMIPAAACAVRLPRNFRHLLDDFAREVLRQQPYKIDQFGAQYFADLLEKRKNGESIEYQLKTSYIDAQFQAGNQIVVPSFDQNPKGSQTTGSSHFLVTSDDEDFGDEIYSTGPTQPKESQPQSPLTIIDEEETMAPIDTVFEGFQEDVVLKNLVTIKEEQNF